jgi:protein-S-isoprenylcysteine O-methyltransferase Ste14
VNLVAALHALSGAAAVVVSLYTEGDLWASAGLIRALGWAIFAGGMLLFVVAVVYLKRAFLGDIDPATDTLQTRGPYRLVRHPLYLGMFVATIGFAIAFGSLWGMLIVVAVFIPAGLWRARLEEEALARKFGTEWQQYAKDTHFILPLVF